MMLALTQSSKIVLAEPWHDQSLDMGSATFPTPMVPWPRPSTVWDVCTPWENSANRTPLAQRR